MQAYKNEDGSYSCERCMKRKGKLNGVCFKWGLDIDNKRPCAVDQTPTYNTKDMNQIWGDNSPSLPKEKPNQISNEWTIEDIKLGRHLLAVKVKQL